jgi:hypothetical protein
MSPTHVTPPPTHMFFFSLRISRRQFPKFDAELNICGNPTLPLSIQDKTFIFVRLPEEDSRSQSSKGEHRSSKCLCWLGLKYFSFVILLSND